MPSGASKGIFEAIELRDKSKDYNGEGVLISAEKINNEIKRKILDVKFNSQEDLDNFLIKIRWNSKINLI